MLSFDCRFIFEPAGCEKCVRRGRYHLHRLIERYGIDAKPFDWEPEADRANRQRTSTIYIGARCANLSKVV
jgi:hypothetical protein